MSASPRPQGNQSDRRGFGVNTEPRIGPSESAVSDEVDPIERCNALLKGAFRQCSRRAKGITGLCVQHRVLGCHSPWRGWDAEGHPVGMWRTVIGTRDGGMGCA